MKKYILISLMAIATIVFFINAYVERTRPVLAFSQTATYQSFGNTAADTIRAADTLSYKFSVDHTNMITPYIQLKWTKILAANPTVTVAFFQSNDNINYKPILKGKYLSSYTKTLSPTATTNYDISLRNDTASFEGRWVKMQIITSSSTASTTKAGVGGTVKFNIN